VEYTLNWQQLKSALESLLFVTRKPLTAEELVSLTGATAENIEAAIGELTAKFENEESGIRVIKVAHGYLMGTAAANADYVDRLVNSKIETTLSPQSLEALAIISYKQPVTRAELEAIRGVYCDGVIDSLLAKKMIEEKGRSRALGRPILYGTTNDFLRHFGLKDLSELPPLPEAMSEQQGLFKSALQEALPLIDVPEVPPEEMGVPVGENKE
jgi:segregation and condensation protein B